MIKDKHNKMRSRRSSKTSDVKESVMHVLNKYRGNKRHMSIDEISLLISYVSGGQSVSKRNVQKAIENLVDNGTVEPRELPEEEGLVGYKLL